MNWLEVSLTVNGELAESVADVFARFAPNGVMTEQGVKFLDEEDEGTATGPITVRAYLEVNEQLEDTRQKLEESLFYLGMITPVPNAMPGSILMGIRLGSGDSNHAGRMRSLCPMRIGL